MPWSRFARLIGLVAAAVLWLAAAAEAKLVAIVFDTSGSMGPRYQLPRFGMEMLAATVDGRAGFDRVWTLNFNHFADACNYVIPEAATIDALPCDMAGEIRKYDLSDQAQHQRMVTSMSADFTPGDRGTPYGPLEVMLNEIANGARQGEDVALIVVSDGLYHESGGATDFDKGAYVAQMKRSFATYRERILARGATLRAEFLFIDATGQAEDKVREQGVRDTLLATFNAIAADGAHHVTGKDALWEALTAIIARVSGTDREAQRPFVTYADNAITVESPLSISRLVVVATAPAGAALPNLVSARVGGTAWTDSREVSAAMPMQDPEFVGAQLRGKVRQLWFQNPVPAGRHTLEFDAPTKDGVFLLFETSAITDLRAFRSDDTEVLPDANGVRQVFLGQTYQFRSRILDSPATPGAAPAPVDLDSLPDSLAMFVNLADSGGSSVHSMEIDPAADEGRWTWTPAAVGQVAAQSRATAGILSPQSTPLSLSVLDAVAEITVSPIVPDVDCAACASGEVASPVTPGAGGSERVGRFAVGSRASIPGQVDLSSTVLPDGYELRRTDGTVVDIGKPLDMQPGETLELEIWRPGAVAPQALARGTEDITVIARPSGGWTGPETAVPSVVRLTPPGMGMRLVAVTQPITPGQVDGLVVPGGELLRGRFSAQFALTDLIAPSDPAAVDMRGTAQMGGSVGWLVALDASLPDPAATGFHALDVRPRSNYLCLCFLGIGNAITGTVAYQATARFENTVGGVVLQAAEAPLVLHLPVGVTLGSLSCLLDFLVALLAVMFLRGIVALVRTDRFPRGSMVEIQEGRAVPRFKRLDTGNSVWWKAWFALFTGDPHEVRTIEGLRITANRRGGTVDLSRNTPPWTVDRLGESFAQLKESNPRKTEYALIWGDRIENTHRPTLSLRLKKRSSDL